MEERTIHVDTTFDLSLYYLVNDWYTCHIWPSNTKIYRGSPFSSSLGVRPLFVIENAYIMVFHYDEKCLQMYDYKDSFDSLILYVKQSHKIQSSRPLEIGHPQDLRTSSFHAIPRTSTPRIRLCNVRSSDLLESLCG